MAGDMEDVSRNLGPAGDDFYIMNIVPETPGTG
jgi:hypothetical protein